ncbi:hypothetical protein EPUS_07452 [Endocarpon pusillum Z07020]|uniref:Uncharacterized protein n=1 Tax=Endocarpon pusillum (strain Z07020 / HMAS-L-300199) TaxID=1263415 RepID=U1G3V0_ENDPU|nr:uncharacterized protein EPUS_07452 [Endocarpon pusillum Z07020]ERF71982.1 hypothetical protein EPUS_07452 [Endocarpon pusillum Z07020]
MVLVIKDFNDNLESLFADAKSKGAILMSGDIDQSEEPQALHLLQEATADEGENITETASMKLGTLQSTTAAPSALPKDARIIAKEANAIPQGYADGTKVITHRKEPEAKIDELPKASKALELYIVGKSKGVLTLA